MHALAPIVLLLTTVAPNDTPPSFAVEVADDYNRRFYREDGWTGADIASSVLLRDGRILWLFGDTWIGTIRQGRRRPRRTRSSRDGTTN